MKERDPITPASQSNLVLRDALWGKTIFLLDLEVEDLFDLYNPVLVAIQEKYELSETENAVIQGSLARMLHNPPSSLSSGAMLFHRQEEDLDIPIQIFIRFKKPLVVDQTADSRVQFTWILFSPTETHPFVSSVAEFFQLMEYRWFRKQAIKETSQDALINLYKEGLDKAVNFELLIVDEPEVSGPFHGIKEDLKNRLPYWVNDFRCGFNMKVLASILFMFFACAAPTIAFGALIDTLTEGHIGVIETILATVFCGTVWSFLGGQPLLIMALSGPNVIFTGILYKLCQYFKIDFLGTCLWVGLWCMCFLILLAIFNVSSLIRYITRFTDEIFATLISFIFLHEAMKDILSLFHDSRISHDTSLFSLILALGTFGIAITLSRVRRTPYLRSYVREFLSDFGPTIALGVMTYIAFQFPSIELKRLNVPSTFQASIERSWFVNPFSVPQWVWLASAIPATLLAVLIWINQNISARLVNNSEHKLKKGTSYHWDILIMGLQIGTLSLFGLPWTVGAAVQSINHVRSLLVTKHDVIIRTIETRVSNLGVTMLMALSLFLLPVLRTMPIAVFFGIFLFMGIGSLGGNQFIGRLKIWFMDPQLFEPTHHLRAVPTKIIHIFTGIQLVCLAALWMVKASFLSILFPLFVALLVPIRMLISKFIEPEYVALLDLEEAPEKFRDFGV